MTKNAKEELGKLDQKCQQESDTKGNALEALTNRLEETNLENKHTIKAIGEETKEEYEKLSKKVPFNAGFFKDFKDYPKKDLKYKLRHIKDLKNFENLINKMLKYIPEERITAEEALKHPFFRNIEKI